MLGTPFRTNDLQPIPYRQGATAAHCEAGKTHREVITVGSQVGRPLDLGAICMDHCAGTCEGAPGHAPYSLWRADDSGWCSTAALAGNRQVSSG